MTEELNQPQPPSASPNPNPGPNPNPNGGGGGGRRRRRRRSKKGGGGAQMQGGQQPNGNGGQQHSQGPRHQHKQHSQHRKQHAGQGGGQGNQRRGRNQRRGGGQPFVGPMDHSYRSGQANGNVADNYRPGSRGMVQSHFTDVEPVMNPVASVDGPARIFCFIDDLFFLAKIQEVSRKLGIKVEFVKTPDPILERLADDVPEEERPALVIFDLNNLNAKPLSVIPKLRAKLKKSASIIGFVSHVQGDLKVKAQEAGCDMVMPRSAFSQNLPNLLRRHSEGEEDVHEDIGNR